MNNFLRLLLIVLLGMPTALSHGQSSGFDRMDASLRKLVRGHSNDVQLGKASARRTVDIFVQLENGTPPESVRTPGMTIRTIAGDIAVVRLPVDEIPVLARKSGIRRMEASQTRQLLHDESRKLIGLDDVHAGLNLDSSFMGEGVIVGILDSGIDVNHPDFRDENGTRVQYLLEFLDPEEHTEDYRIYTKEEIDADVSSIEQIDGNGHGTHVAGTAAGNGSGDAAFVGMAPKADIVVVKGTRSQSGSSFEDADVVNGTDYIFTLAEELGKPAVVNLSLGGHTGPHDGTSLYEQALSNLTGPGRIIVAAAGNEGNDRIHVGHEATAGSSYLYIGEADNEDFLLMEAWMDAGLIDRVSVGVIDLVDSEWVVVGQSDWVSSGDFAEDLDLVVDGDVVARVSMDTETTMDPNNGDANVQIAVLPVEGFDIQQYFFGFIVETSGAGRMDAWTLGGYFTDLGLLVSGYEHILGDWNMTVGNPATAEKVIAVGAFVSKNFWISADGSPFNWTDPTLGNFPPSIGSLGFFSSKGPTRDGRVHPEISAPGALIFSAHSADAVDAPAFRMLAGERYIGFEGTSMASPHIAGIVALMLEADASLDYEDVIHHLQSTAVLDFNTGDEPGYEFGAGKVDALAAMQSVTGYSVSTTQGEELPESVTLSQNYPNPFNPETSISFSLPRGMEVQVQVFDVLGRQIMELVDAPMASGSHTVRFDASGRPSGMYLVRLSTENTTLTRKMVLLK